MSIAAGMLSPFSIDCSRYSSLVSAIVRGFAGRARDCRRTLKVG